MADDSGSSGSTVMLCADARPAWFDPHNQIAGAARVLADNVVPGLFSVGDDGAPAVSLATEWGWEEETVASIRLSEGYRFTSGRAVNSQAVCRNLWRARKSDSSKIFNADEFRTIARCQEHGGHSIIVRLNRRFAPLFGVLANSFGIVDPDCGDPPRNVTGAGNFELMKITTRAILLRSRSNPGKVIEWRFCSSEQARVPHIQSGRCQVLLGTPGHEVAEVAGWKCVRRRALGPVHLAFNLRRWPMSNLGFRWAVAEAVDKHEVLRLGFGGQGRIAHAPYSGDSAFPICAEPMRRAAGRASSGKELLLAVGGETMRKAALVVARAVSRALRCPVHVASIPNPEWWPRYYLEASWDLALQSWTPMPDPHLVYARRYSSQGIHNAPGYANPRFDKIIVAASQITDMRKRVELYQEAERLRAADLPTLYLAFPDRVAWIAPGVTGLCLRPSWAIELGAVRIINRKS